jgi:hypothetical protein
MKFTKSTPISLKVHPEYNEKWLQTQIVQDPSILGLGDLQVKDVERRQPRAGRLDLLLSDPETNTRYEVELQLGSTDEAHIIRTIEYWDLEKGRFPQYEHVAVIVAEDITSRFLNVISLFNRAIPLIAIQLNALQVGDLLTLKSTTVLDAVQYGTDEEDEPGQVTDRTYWEQKGSKASLALADEFLGLIHQVRPGLELKYNKYYIGLAKSGIPDNFIIMRPRKEHVGVEFRIARNDATSTLIDDSELDALPYDKNWGKYRIRITAADLEKRREILLQLVREAVEGPTPIDD